MSTKKISIVFTTINVPHLLRDYVDHFRENERKENIEFLVVGDKKTPRKAKEVVNEVDEESQYKASYLSVEWQKEWLKKYPKLDDMIPYNSDNRRNIGYLVAAERDSDIIISIDDDNFPSKQDYIEHHLVVGTKESLPTAKSKNDWYNICRLLETKPEKREIYPRGFPYSRRWEDTEKLYESTGKIVMNAGLWLNDPDVDAITRLNEQIKSVGGPENPIMLDRGTFCPINTQNTSFLPEILPAYYFIRMDTEIRGRKLDRYGDIWSGLFAKKCIDHMNDRISFGPPMTDHQRNEHDLLKDLEMELQGMILTNKIVPILERISLSGSSYSETYLDLGQKILDESKKNEDFDDDEIEYISNVFNSMRAWVNICDDILV